jgi:hypothetical protein
MTATGRQLQFSLLMINVCNRCTPDVGPVNLTGSSGSTAPVKHERFVMGSSESRYLQLA